MYRRQCAVVEMKIGWLLDLYYFGKDKFHSPWLPVTRRRFLLSLQDVNAYIGHYNLKNKMSVWSSWDFDLTGS